MSSILLIHSGPILFSFGRIDLDVSQFYVSLIGAVLGGSCLLPTKASTDDRFTSVPGRQYAHGRLPHRLQCV